MKKTLVDIFAEIGHFGEDIGCNDRGGTHTYLETYEKLFSPKRSGSTILEIGLALGDGIRLWDNYFDHSFIFGADISVVFDTSSYTTKWRTYNQNEVTIIESDATKEQFLKDLPPNIMLDVILDDASHMEADQIATFQLLKHKMKPGGVYVIEDILAIDQNRKRFEALHDNCEIVDMRHINGRFDNVLIIYRF